MTELDAEWKSLLLQAVYLTTFLSIYFGWEPLGQHLRKIFPNSNGIAIFFSDKVGKFYLYASIGIGVVIYFTFKGELPFIFTFGIAVVIVLTYLSYKNISIDDEDKALELADRYEVCGDCKTEKLLNSEDIRCGFFDCSRCGKRNNI